MMEQDIKYNDIQERQAYVPASVKVVEIAVQRVLCGSTEQYGNEEYNPWA